jgi:hypothetical protein
VTLLPKAVKIAMALVPALMKVLPDIEAKVAAAKAPNTPDGIKVGPGEVAQIVADEIPTVLGALVSAITAAVS